MKTLTDHLQSVLPENTVVLFHTEQRNIKTLAESLGNLQKTFARYGITAIAVPNNITVTVLPTGTKLSDVKIVNQTEDVH